MTDTPHSQENTGSTEILQAPWLHQSYLIGHPFEQKERYAEALEVYNQVLEQNREHILAHLLKGGALLSLNRDEEALATFQQALQLAEQALQRNRADPQAWIYRGDALWLLDPQQTDAALAAYDEAIRLAPENPEAYVNKGWVLFTLARQEALQTFEKARELRPHDGDVHYRLNCVLWEMGKYEEALQAIEQAIALDPSSPRFYLARSTVLSYMGREEEAQQAKALYERLKNESG